MKKKGLTKIFLGVMFMALTIALGGCSGDKTGDENSSKITIGIPQDLEESLDPHKAVAAGTKEVLFNIYEGLVKPDSEGNLNPAVASEVNISDDGKVYTFTLREGVKFHDGSLVTAEDVKYSIERCADADNESLLVPAFSNIDSVNILDENTIEVVLVEGDTNFLANFTAAIIPKSNTDTDTNPIGTGPYKYVSRSPQENFIVEKFDEYWGEGAHIEQVVFKICANADSIVMELQGGGIDMFCRLTAAQVEQLGDDYEIYEGTMNLVQAMYLNNAVEPFNNELVRQALCYVVDPQEIMDFTADGKGTEVGSKLEEIKEIIDKIEDKDHIGVCLDTCHLSDGGYDIENFDAFLDEFDNLIGINKIGCVHVNDSKNELGAHKDRHENIGIGTIGFNNLIKII